MEALFQKYKIPDRQESVTCFDYHGAYIHLMKDYFSFLDRLAPISENVPDSEGDLPFEFYANLYRGSTIQSFEDPKLPNAWDLKALEKHCIWDMDPHFDPYNYDWTNWKWPIDVNLSRFADALRSGGGLSDELDGNDPGVLCIEFLVGLLHPLLAHQMWLSVK